MKEHWITSHPIPHCIVHHHFLNHKPFTGAAELVTCGGRVYLSVLACHPQPFLFHLTTSQPPDIESPTISRHSIFLNQYHPNNH